MSGVPVSVASEFLSCLKSERAFDGAFIAMLQLLGFKSVAFTHGAYEFGRDFIGQFEEQGQKRQWSFQSKLGNMADAAWREVEPQLRAMSNVEFQHPMY